MIKQTLRNSYKNALDEDIDELAPWIEVTLRRYAITSLLRKAHFLAQIGHESGELRYREELASGDAYDTRTDLGNTPQRDGDGRTWKGRGLIQCTGRANYAAYAVHCGLGEKLMENPGLLANDPELCVDVAGWYWDRNNINRWADKDDLIKVTKAINGGTNGLQHRRELLVSAKRALLQPKMTAKDIQSALNVWQIAAVPLEVDGIIGIRTTMAVRAFQAAHDLVPDGIVGPLTIKELEKYRQN